MKRRAIHRSRCLPSTGLLQGGRPPPELCRPDPATHVASLLALGEPRTPATPARLSRARSFSGPNVTRPSLQLLRRASAPSTILFFLPETIPSRVGSRVGRWSRGNPRGARHAETRRALASQPGSQATTPKRLTPLLLQGHAPGPVNLGVRGRYLGSFALLKARWTPLVIHAARLRGWTPRTRTASI